MISGAETMHIYSNIFCSNLPSWYKAKQTRHVGNASVLTHSVRDYHPTEEDYQTNSRDLQRSNLLELCWPSHYWVQWPGRPLATYREQLSPSTLLEASSVLIKSILNNSVATRQSDSSTIYLMLLKYSINFYWIVKNYSLIC